MNPKSIHLFLKYIQQYLGFNKYAKLVNPPPWDLLIKKIRWTLRNKISSFLIREVVKEPLKGEKYLFYPLHFTYEAEISYLETFTNQLNIIHNVAMTLPKDVYLYVKPHPHWLFVDLSIAEVSKLAKNKKIKIISPTANTYKFIRHSMGILTINSTVGLESLALGKPVVTFGHDFYCKEGVATVVRDLNELPKIVNALYYSKIKTDKSKIDEFLATYFNHLIDLELEIGVGDDVLSDRDSKQLVKEMASLLKTM